MYYGSYFSLYRGEFLYKLQFDNYFKGIKINDTINKMLQVSSNCSGLKGIKHRNIGYLHGAY